MFIKRYVLIVDDISSNGFPAISELPMGSLDEAIDALRAEFERIVHRCFGADYEIAYTAAAGHENGHAVHLFDLEKGNAYSFALDADGGPSFFVCADGVLYRGVLREITTHLDATELERSYRERERQYRREAAERHLYEFCGFNPDAEEGSEEEAESNAAADAFADVYGFCIDEAANYGSEYYLLDRIVCAYEKNFDCNVPENDSWEHAIATVLNEVVQGGAVVTVLNEVVQGGEEA